MNFFRGRVIRGTILDVSRRQNAIFWVSQCAVILSTIVGVYLAASEGLKSAVEFHAATNLERKYFTLNSLQLEIEKNNALIVDFSERNLVEDEKGNVRAHRSLLVPELNWFVWNTLSQSQDSLELPFDILHNANQHVSSLKNLIVLYHDSRGSEKLSNGKQLQTLVTSDAEPLMTRMSEQIANYRERLTQYDTLGDY